MYSYTVIQWLFFFYFYCFFGWCFESAYVSIKSRKFVNRGFMRGPFLPLYGTGAIMMLLVSMPFHDNILLVYIAGCIGATVLEYVTGVTMEALFKVRYWDYSKNRFNFQGHICLGSSLAWGFLTILMTSVIHKPIEQFVLSIPSQLLTVITLLLTACICSDFALSFKAAMDLRDILVKMEKVKEEMLHIQRRLDVMIALANEDWENRKEEYEQKNVKRREELSESITGRIEDVKSGVEEKLEYLREKISQWKPETISGGNLDKVKEELQELKEKYSGLVLHRDNLSNIKDWFQRDLISANPSMSSIRFKEALEELKKRAERKPDKKVLEDKKVEADEKEKDKKAE